MGVPHSCVVSYQSLFLYVTVLHQELLLWVRVRVTCCNIPVTCCLQFTSSSFDKATCVLAFQPVREVAGKNMQKAKQNGKDSKPSTPASKSKVSENS